MSAILDLGLLPGMEETSSSAPPPEFGEWAQVAPGQFVTAADDGDLPSYTLAKIIPGEGDDFTLQPEGSTLGYVRLNKKMTFARTMGIEGLSRTTLRRLCYAGFVDYIQLAPHTMLISVDSFLSHLHSTKNSRDDEGGFWTEEKLDVWRESYGV